MLDVCSATHDCERGIYLRNQAQALQLTPDTRFLNSLVKVLGRRVDYAHKALDVFYEMSEAGLLDEKSFTFGLAACATLGDVRQAFSILNLMRGKGVPSNPFALDQVLRVYAQACSNPVLE